MAVYTIFFIFMILKATTGKLFTPDHFYRINPKNSHVLDGTVYQGRLNLSTPLRLMDYVMERKIYINRTSNIYEMEAEDLLINKNGIITFDPDTDITPTKSLPYGGAFAPLWSWLSFADGTGAVFYHQTTNQRIKKQAVQDVKNNFCGVEAFDPATVIIATWYNMVSDPCTTEHNNANKYCQCVNFFSSDVCQQCVDYPIEDHCDCRNSNYSAYMSCECYEYFSYEPFFGRHYVSEYCSCLHSYSRELCECWSKSGFYYREYPYCECMDVHGEDSEIYCKCSTNFLGYAMITGYCECLQDYYDKFETIDIGDDLCSCVYQYEYNDYPMGTCMCQYSSQSQEYCNCLDQFSSYFDNHFDVHEYCLCYSKNLANGTECICDDTCTSKRALPSPSVKVGFHVQRRDAITPVPGDGSVGKWSRSYNTFQAVIIADSNSTYLIFNYASIGIPKYLGNGIRPAVVGITDKYHGHFIHEFSYSNRLNKLKGLSNVGIRGRWMYKVDSKPVQEPHQC